MNLEDACIVRAEQDSDPVRFHDYDPNNRFDAEYERIESAHTQTHTEPAEVPAAETPLDEAIEEEEDESSRSSADSDVEDDSRRRQHRPSVTSRASTRMEMEFMVDCLIFGWWMSTESTD